MNRWGISFSDRHVDWYRLGVTLLPPGYDVVQKMESVGSQSGRPG